jgi:hypothetical protein
MSALDGIEKELWTDITQIDEALLHQYELYIHQAEQISARRHLASIIFILTSLALIIYAGSGGDKFTGIHEAAFYAAALLIQIIWFLLARSNRNLNSAKVQNYRIDGKTRAGLALLGS